MLGMSGMAAFSTLLVNAEVLSLLAEARAGRVLRDRLEMADSVATLMAVFSMVIAAGAAAAFSVWLYRALGNLQAAGSPARYTPGYAVWAFFIPGLNLVVPVRAVRDAWASPPRFLGLWWAAWILCNVLSWTSAAMGFRHDYENGLAIGIAGDAVTIVAAVLAIRVVRGLSERLDRQKDWDTQSRSSERP
jgi:hypothetical protein